MNYPDDFINKVIQGDCLEIMKQMPDKCVDLVLTSPPYDEARDYEGFSWNFDGTIGEVKRILKDTGVITWNVGDTTKGFCESLTSFKQAIAFVEKHGLLLVDTMIYEKLAYPPTYPGIKRFVPAFEYVFILAKTKDFTFNQIRDKENKHAGKIFHGTQRQKDGTTKSYGSAPVAVMGLRPNVWKYFPGADKDIEKKKHPATMPDTLAKDLCTAYSNEGDTVLDPFLGSGTTAVAAKQLGRKFIGIELSEKYCEIARKRLEQETLF